MAINRELFLNIANFYRQKKAEDEASAKAAESRNFNPFNALIATVAGVMSGGALLPAIGTALGGEYLRTQGEITGAPNEARIAASSILNKIFTARSADADLKAMMKGTTTGVRPTSYEEFRKSGQLGAVEEKPFTLDTFTKRFENTTSEKVKELLFDMRKEALKKQLLPTEEKPIKKTKVEEMLELGKPAPTGKQYGWSSSGERILEDISKPEKPDKILERPTSKIIVGDKEYNITFDDTTQKNNYLSLLDDVAASPYNKMEDPITKKVRNIYAEDYVDLMLAGKNKEYNTLPESVKILLIQKIKELMPTRKGWFGRSKE